MEICTDKIKILVALKETAGDIFLITGTINSLKKKYPNSNLYVACDRKYWEILEENPEIKGVMEWHDTMWDYRLYAKWAMNDNLFDIVYLPAIQTQRAIGNWLNGPYAVNLAKFYANVCNVKLGKMFIAKSPIDKFNLPEEYVTVQGQSGQDPKNYDAMPKAVNAIKLQTVQLGAQNDTDMSCNIDLRGKTTFKEAASVIAGAKMHLGLDSVLMHFAAYRKTSSVILFGGTLPQAAVSPDDKFITVVDTEDRGPCKTSCHLINCEAKNQGFDKCINNIQIETVLKAVQNHIGKENVEMPKPLTLSSYFIIRDGIKYGFPFEKAITAAVKISDEVVIVDGGSTDGTYEKLLEMVKIGEVLDTNKLKIYKHEWNMDIPTLFGDEKQFAREQCTGDWLLQLDSDEIIHEPEPGMIRKIITKSEKADLLSFAQINLYGDENHIRVEEMCWKWRLSKNNPRIVHGVHGAARQFDAETMQITMDKKISDGCEFIYRDTLEIVPPAMVFDPKFMEIHEEIRQGKRNKEDYTVILPEVIKRYPVTFHYSWMDLERKKANGEFWRNTYHGKKSWTHNTTQDIAERIENNPDIIVKVDLSEFIK